MEFKPGDQVAALCIERELGRGAYGIVYLARDSLIGRRVALKVLPGRDESVPEEVCQRILTEARLIGNLVSPNIVTLYRLHATEDGGWMQEMEFVDGGTLENRLEEGEPLPFDRALHVFLGVSRALKTAHAARIIHGDIKPANVLFGADDLVKLADFGLARMLEGSGAIPLHGRVFGSPRYMAPEVISGQEAGMASDLWSTAVLLYRLATGRYPFDATSFPTLAHQILNEDPAPLDGEMPEPLAALLLRCLAKRSGDRPQSAGALIEELDRIAAQDVRLAPMPAARERPTNCVQPTTSFVGREQELADIASALREEAVRLLTVTGPGGIGKTRLSLRLCDTLLEHFEGGCWFVDLSETRDADGIAHAVAQALGVPSAEGDDPVKRVGEVLQYRKPMLLVLDNFEQLLDHVSATVGRWLGQAPRIRFLVTSRALLQLAGERPYELPPLPTPSLKEGLPPDPAVLEGYAGIRLFVDRASEANPEFVLDGNAQDVARICAELDGMPLAIELAAARTRIMQPAQIARKLGQKFKLLKSTRRDLTPRQRTLTGAIDWSFELLEDWEKEGFLQACHFQDGFTLDAAEEVIDLSAFDEAPLAMDLVQSLRDKSLLTAYDAGFETRMSMYRAIHDYGASLWRDTMSRERRDALARRHAAYYRDYAEQWSVLIPGPRDEEALQRISSEIGNLTAAQGWAAQAGDAETVTRVALAAAETMLIRRPPRQLIPLLERALQVEGADEDRVRLQVHLCAACQRSGDWNRAVECAQGAVSLARGLESAGVLADALLQLGEMQRNRGEQAEALASLAESERAARDLGDRRRIARAIGIRGFVLWQKDMDQAYECFRAAERIGREIGDQQTVALCACNRGVVYESRGELEAAIAAQQEAEDIARRIGNRLRAAVCLGNRANVLVQQGKLGAALSCYREAEAMARELGVKQRVAQIVGNKGSVHAMRDEFDAALECFAEAEAISRELGDQRRIALDESALDESKGLTPVGDVSGYGTTWWWEMWVWGDHDNNPETPDTEDWAPVQQWTTNAAGEIDWRVVNDSNPGGIAGGDINTGPEQTSIYPEVLKGHNDWLKLVFTGGNVGGGIPLPLPAKTPAEELDLETTQTLLVPVPVTKLKGHAAKRMLHLTWKPAGPQKKIKEYRIRRDGVQIGTSTTTEYKDSDVAAGVSYTYAVVWVNLLGQESVPSEEVVLKAK